MVHKTTHRGVHSGHTLRAFNSRFSRRYHHQSCIVSRIRPELIRKLAGGAKADELRNVAVNVPLSLNKQSRWFLPSALIRQIQSNDIADSDLTVSVVERHKLKQHASCVSFHSNKGEAKRIQPRNGRYFGYSYPTADGKSRRALRRERRADKNSKKGKTVEVFTEQGPANRNLGDSEVRYEVYYPCPAWSAISHNPKYIKQGMHTPPEETNERVQNGRPRKQHRGKQRKRISVKDLDACDLPSFQYLSLKDHDLPAFLPAADLPLTAVPDHKEPALELEGIRKEQNTTECLLTTLIEKAQQLQNFRDMAKPRPKKRNDKNAAHHEDNKSHIVYVSDLDLPSSPAQTSDRSSPLVCPLPPSPAEATRVMLPKEDVTLTSLKDCFGQNYFEAACKPRKFVLDITVNVQDVLKKLEIPARAAEKTSDAYLVCVHDGIYDDEYDVYKVLLNSRLHQGVLPVQINIEEKQDLYRGTVMNLVSQTMDFVESLVTKLKEKDEFSALCPDTVTWKPLFERQLHSHIGSAEAYVPSVRRLFQKGSDVSDIAMPSLTDLLQEDPVFCEVCYEDISPMSLDSAAYTSLLKCGHQVCDTCWWRHIHTRLGEGFVRLPCPGHDCQQEVKLGVLLSLLPLPTVDKLLQRQEEVRIGGSSMEKWCPNPACGRVIRLQGSVPTAGSPQQQDVVCGCGSHVCFQCLAPAHWPASCQQAQNYRSNLDTTIFPDRLAEVHDDFDIEQNVRLQDQLQEENTMQVEGKLCPKCKTFVFKISGCPQMTCRCGQLFCWYCLSPGYGHPSRFGCVTAKKEKELTTTLVVRHLEADSSSEATKKENQAQAANRRQRMSLLERAAEHRSHHDNEQSLRSVTTLAKKVASAAAKDTVLSQHILQACTEAFPSSCKPSASTGGSAPIAQASVLETVTAFLKKVACSKRELHQVVEYSLVLLKDLPDSLPRRRALRISEDLGAFCSFSQSVFDAWDGGRGSQAPLQEGVKAVMRLTEIQGWVRSALDAHIATVRKLRSLRSPHL